MIILKTLPSRSRRYFAEWLGLLVGLLILGGYIGYSQYQDYIGTGSRERERLTVQAAVIEKNLTPQLVAASQTIDGILEALPAWKRQNGDMRLADHRLQLLTNALTGIRSILIISAEGRVLSSNKQELIGRNVSGRDYFQAARKNANPKTLYVTSPFRTVLDTFVIGLYRIIPGPAGTFGGMIIASFDPESFETLLDSVRYTSDTRALLIHGDGKLFMVAPARPDLNGKDLAVPDSLFTRHRNSGQATSLFAETAYVTNEERMSAFQTIQPARLAMDKSLVVVVSRDLQTIFAAWGRETRIQSTIFVLLALISILTLFFYQRRQRASDHLADTQGQALQSSEARLHSFFDATPDVLLISDAQGMITMANRQVNDLLGYAADELIGQSIEILVPDRSRANHPSLRAMFAASPINRRMGQGLAVSARRKDGSEVEAEISLGRIETAQGLFFACGLRDITERKQADKALRESEQRFRALTAMSSDFYWQSDAEHRLTQRTESARETAEEVVRDSSSIGKRGWDIPYLSPDESGWAKHRGLLDAHLPFRGFQISRPRSNGAVHHLSLSGDPMFDSVGQFTGYCGIGADTTEHKLFEADLRIAATTFESQEGMMVTDAGSVILKVNRAFTTITGYTAEEAVGQTPRLLNSGRHNAAFYREMWETINRTGGWQGEVWDRRKNGEVYPKWLAISAVKDDDGTVTNYIGTHYDISVRKHAEERIHELAFFDQLTGLPNRTLLLDRLKQTMTASGRSGSYGALLFIDLDNFKELNDTLGHDVGDLLLKQVAERLTQCVREGDTVARLGGDEFVVILANLSFSATEAGTGTETVAEKILASLNQVYRFGDAAHHSTASIGATLFNGHPISIDSLMKQADLTMYKAKEAGRNTLRFFDPAMEVAVKARAALESDLRAAVEAKRFVLHYQAQVAGGQVTGAEVLVRWKHAERGMVSPAEFIPLAEETGLILPLGHWVLETACAQLAVWATQPAMTHFTLAVNVSARQFSQPDFVDHVLAVLADTGANPRRLKLELTESILADNVQDIIEKMHALKAKGIGFSLDDFGTGYSSLSYLKRLPLDQLKIDQSFVRDVMVDANDAAIARTIVALAQSLGLGVIAEGVETEAQKDFLASSGCHAYQGYFFSRPLVLEAFESFARDMLCPA
jgi:diguanylate cyclase (GGDEF)-like protein/PAS domain S-box-containing protein